MDQLLRIRCVPLKGTLDDEVAALVIARLLFLENEGSAPVSLLVDSVGGSVSASLAVLDTMAGLKVPVRARCYGRAGGTAALILAAGQRGERLVGEGSVVLLTPVGFEGTPGAQVDVDRLSQELAKRMAAFTGRTPDSVAQDMVAGITLGPTEAVHYGIADRVAVS